MIPFQERKKLRKILYSKVTLTALFFLLILVGRGAWAMHQKAVVAQTERDITERSLSDLESRTTELQSSFTSLKSNQGIETTVRQKYTVALPNEDVVIVVDDSGKKGDNGDAVNSRGVFESILYFLGLKK